VIQSVRPANAAFTLAAPLSIFLTIDFSEVFEGQHRWADLKSHANKI
jgi:hypothetical protein